MARTSFKFPAHRHPSLRLIHPMDPPMYICYMLYGWTVDKKEKLEYDWTECDILLLEFIDTMSENSLDTDSDDETDGAADTEDNSTALAN